MLTARRRAALLAAAVLAVAVLAGSVLSGAPPAATLAPGSPPARVDGAHPPYAFAPYIDLTGYPEPNLSAIMRASGADQMTLGFVIAPAARACTATWGGYATAPASGPGAYDGYGVAVFRDEGGTPIASFGGEAGTELADACPTVTALTDAYAGVLAAYRATHVDFDVEGAALDHPAAIARRSAAIAALQAAAARRHRRLTVSLTLPVLPTGLPPASLNIVRSAIAHHVRIGHVNLMTMDFGAAAAPHPSRMTAYAIDAGVNAAAQLRALYPGRSAGATAAMIGLTPMIGVNDDHAEVFTLADARRLAAATRAEGFGLLSMWQLARDRACPTPEPDAQSACSGVSQRPYAFAAALAG